MAPAPAGLGSLPPSISGLDSAKLAATAIEKCMRWKNPQKLDPGNYTVVLEPTAAGDLVRLMAAAFSARNTEEGRDVPQQARRRQPARRKDVSRVHHPAQRSLRSAPAFLALDRRLLPTRAMTWIDQGVIANLAYDRYWATKTGKEPTPGAGSVEVVAAEAVAAVAAAEPAA